MRSNPYQRRIDYVYLVLTPALVVLGVLFAVAWLSPASIVVASVWGLYWGACFVKILVD